RSKRDWSSDVCSSDLAHDAGVVAIVPDVGPDRLPHRLEDGGRAGEVDTGEMGTRQSRVSDLGAGPVDEVDDAGRQAGLFIELHQIGRASCRESGDVDG